ncbi:MAG TPA: kelch repeat-containing protein [Candidatus Binatus sp.]|nr:kelch repeat-containing protein [Candidatus Binatus sp.]
MRVLAGAFAAIVLLAQSPGSAAQLTWHETASMGWTHSALVAVHSGPNIYLIGDRDNLHIYNIANNSWSKGTAPPLNQYGPAVALNGKIYVIGGVTGPKITGNVIAYDPATDKWSNAASLPSPHGAAAAAVLGGKIHLVGGRAYQGATLVDVNDHLVYDPAANAWSKSTPMPTSRDSLSLVADPSSGRLFAIGGFNEQTRNPSGKNEIYSSSTHTWTEGARLPTPRFASGSALVNGVIFILGGSTTTAMYANVDAYTIASDTWKTLGGLPSARPLESAVAVNGTIYATGGILCQANACYQTNKFWLLTPP